MRRSNCTQPIVPWFLTEKCDVFSRLMRDARRGSFQAVVLRDISRFIRNIRNSRLTQVNAKQVIRHYTDEILRFPELDTISNQDMRRVLDHISVSRDGNVRIVLKKFEDMENI